MKFKYLLLFLLLLPFFVKAQQNNVASHQQIFQSFDRDLSWVALRTEAAAPASVFFQEHYRQFGLEQPQDMKVVKANQDEYGWTHHRYHQYHRGIRVEGGTYILHEKNGRVEKANGHLAKNIRVNTQPLISPAEILDKALATYPAELYAWENPRSEWILQRARNDAKATHYPRPELVILDRAYPETSQDYALAYKFIIHRETPVMDRRMLWYDAHTGELLLDINMMHDLHGEEGTAITRYHGERKIITMQDSTGKFILRDTTRGGGIETYNSNNRDTLGNALLFEDDDNYWNNWNPEQDEVATDVHWGTEATYDFYFDFFGHDSYDNAGATMISNVHVGTNFNNATWNGSAMNYGDGDSITYFPFTTIDIIAHEITHGVTEFSSGLVYRNEPGALNESFSDIMGKAVEAITMPDDFNWNVGQRMSVSGNGYLRSMSDPNLAGDPKFYFGENWITGTFDNGGVHFNSGVQNFWYYLLVEGQQGVNEAGYAYDVPALGFEKATNIAYRNLTSYLTESSNYQDARRGSLQAAGDLYGICSAEYLAVAEAWNAVGVGIPIVEGDFEIDFLTTPVSGCDLGESVIEVTVYNNSCNTVFPDSGDYIVYYQFDDEAIVSEQVSLGGDFAPGTNLSHQFSQTIQDPSFGDHLVKVWIAVPGDTISANDTIEHVIVNRPFQNEEFSTQARLTALEGVCTPSLARSIQPTVRYDGCDTLPALTNIPYRIRYKSSVINQRYRSGDPLPPLSTIRLNESFVVTTYGFGFGEFEVLYPNDPTPGNNLAKVFIARTNSIRRVWSEAFDDFQLDSTYMAVEPGINSHNAIQIVDGSHQLITTGSDVLDDSDSLLIENLTDATEFFNANSAYHTTTYICLNIRNQTNAALLFDYQNTLSDTDWASYGVNPDFATMLQLSVDGEVDTLLYGPDLSTTAQTYWLNLTDYIGNFHELTIKTLALQASIDSSTQAINLTGDNVILDNLQLDFSTSAKDLSRAINFQLSPNPSTNSFRLTKIDGQGLANMQLRLVDVSGKMIFSKWLTADTDTFEFGQQLSPGVYFLQLTNGEENGYFKLIKQ